MARTRILVLTLGLVAQTASALVSSHAATASANPIRRVVTMLQNMQAKISKQGEKEEELFEKFQCYCKKGTSELKTGISDAEMKMPQLASNIEKASAEKTQLAQDVAQATKDRADAEHSLAESKAIREKDAAAYAKDKSDAKSNIKAVGLSIDAISKGQTGFLQTPQASFLRRILPSVDLGSAERQVLASFLSTDGGHASDEIEGILQQMKETMEKDLAELDQQEEEAISTYEALVDSKTKEKTALTQAIESKLSRLGEVGVELVNMKEDLDDTTKAHAEDVKFIADLDKSCASKEEEWTARQKTRAEELVAIGDTIKILNDDDALDLFAHTLKKSPSFFQVGRSEGRKATRSMLRTNQDHRLDLINIALQGKQANFEKITTMIDEMVTLLGKEQADDDQKKEFCNKELDVADDEKRKLERQHGQLESVVAEGKEAIEKFTTDIATLNQQIKDLDQQVVEATKIRKQENQQYKDELAANTATKKLLGIAKNRLNKFYNPALHKPTPKPVLSEADQIAVNLGEEAPSTPPPGGIAGTEVANPLAGSESLAQVSAHRSFSNDVPPPPPETFGAYSKKSQESSGVIAMIDLLIRDMDKELTQMEVEEQNSQADYEKSIADSQEKRAVDAESLEGKESAKAGAEETLFKNEEEVRANNKKILANAEHIRSLHSECDWLLSNFNVRKEARAVEVESLKRGKAVLAGADYSLLEVDSRRHLRKIARLV